ncbi:sugar ABC transporter permease [Streptomyces sp. NPDC006798]|uniref:sugar ABC transporter permease n=1 Tax=Streptomyces sp. NPDC006798 TaxID=3155462 RepID=UPI0033FDD185
MTHETHHHAMTGGGSGDGYDGRAAADRMIERVRRTADEVGERFPLYADPATGVWTTTRRGSWTGGFWAGLLRLTAARTGDPEDRARAVATTRGLRERAADDTDTRGMTFWYGAARTALPGEAAETEQTVREGAAALAAARRSDGSGGEYIPLGSALGHGERGTTTLGVDAAAAVISLLSRAGRTHGEPGWEKLAEAHATAVLTHCITPDGTVLATARPGDPAPAGPAHHGWPRGHAWGMAALTTAARSLRSPAPAFLEAARRTTDVWLELTGGTVPPWSFDDPTGPRDTSAGAIAAETMLRLADTLAGPDAVRYRRAGHGLIARLVGDHLGRPDTAEGAPPAGALLDGCYDMASGTAVAHELIWGDYFLLAALLRPAPAG